MAVKDEETLFEFPSKFPIKVMGKVGAGFHQQVIDIVQKHVPELDESSVSSRMSGNKNYVSITVTIMASSREQLDNIYLDLTACPAVIMAL